MPKAPCLDEFDYVLKEERDLPPEERTVFRLRPLRFREREDVERIEFSEGPDGSAVMVADRLRLARKVLNVGLLGWTSFKDSNGNDIKFERKSKNVIPDEILDLIAPWATELANAITDNSRVTRAQAKN